MLRPLVGVRFQELFHSSRRGAFHLSLTVLVRYRSLTSIWPWRMGPPDSHRISRVPRYSGYHYASTRFRLRGCHPLWRCFPAASPTESSCNHVVLQPRHGRNRGGLGSSPFARHYLGNHCYFLFLQVLRCFSSLGSLSALQSDRTSFCRVVPFGNLRVTGHLRLTGAYRSLSRPSSPVRA